MDWLFILKFYPPLVSAAATAAPLLHNKYVHESFFCTHATASNFKEWHFDDKWNCRFGWAKAFRLEGIISVSDPFEQAQVQQMFEAVLLSCQSGEGGLGHGIQYLKCFI